jgi:hypothetical protein
MAGWVLIPAGSTYGAMKVRFVTSWPRISSKRTSTEFESVRTGQFDFRSIERLFSSPDGEGNRGEQEKEASSDD